MGDKVPVQNNSHLVRDKHSRAIINKGGAGSSPIQDPVQRATAARIDRLERVVQSLVLAVDDLTKRQGKILQALESLSNRVDK